MSSIITQNSVLTGTGDIYKANVSGLRTVELFVEDNGGGSTITFQTSPDGSTWSNKTSDIYTVGSFGTLVLLGAATATAKGRYVIDVSADAYLKVAVTTYVSGSVVTRFNESVASIKWNQDSMTQILGRLVNYIDKSGTSTGSSQTVIAANFARTGFIVQNISDTDMYINVTGGAASAAAGSVKVPAGALYEAPANGVPAAAITLFCSASGKAFTAAEW